ncbi:MAG: hypothetical protein MJ137_06620 [Clostridia bacterium]|nr:hypothetical protein [Clostridia bacterium]
MKDYTREQLRPLSPWAYFGLQILFSIPVIGFVFLIVFSISGSNINRRNFARSYWCVLFIVLVITVVMALLGASSGLLEQLKEFLAGITVSPL